MQFSCYEGARVFWEGHIAKTLASAYQTRPLLDGATVRPLSKGLPPVPTCVVALRLWLWQPRLQVFLSHP